MKALVFTVSAALAMLGCGGGGDDDGGGACVSVAEAFARAWDRCDVESYDEARAIFIDSLDCEANPGAGDGLDECITAIDALTCSAIQSNPSSCQSVLE